MASREQRTTSASRYASSDGPVTRPVVPRDHAASERALARLQQSADDPQRTVLLAGGTIVSMDPSTGNLVGDLLIRGRTIVEVAPNLRDNIPDETIVVDATEKIIAPGFVDSHLHAWEGQLRGLAPAIDFATYMRLTHFGLAAHYRPHDIYVGTLITALGCLDAGVTTILDNSHNTRTIDHSRAAVEAVMDAGIRAVHASGAARSADRSQQDWLTDVIRLREEYFSSDDQLVTLRLYDSQPSTELWSFAKNEGLWVSSEMGSHFTGLKELHAAGLLTAGHTFNHCYGLPASDWALIADAGVKVNVCPRSDATFGLGFGAEAVHKAVENNLRPGLSMDNEISYGVDMFAEMQLLLFEQRGEAFQARTAGRNEPTAHLSLHQILEFATIGGADNCNLGHQIGSLRPGSEADIIMVNTTDINTIPFNNAAATLAVFATRSNIDTVFVAGQPKKWGGQLLGQDLTAIRTLVEESRDYLLTAHGIHRDVFTDTINDQLARPSTSDDSESPHD